MLITCPRWKGPRTCELREGSKGGSPLAAVVDPDAPFGVVRADLVERFGPDVLAATGVLRTFAVLRAGEVEALFDELMQKE